VAILVSKNFFDMRGRCRLGFGRSSSFPQNFGKGELLPNDPGKGSFASELKRWQKFKTLRYLSVLIRPLDFALFLAKPLVCGNVKQWY